MWMQFYAAQLTIFKNEPSSASFIVYFWSFQTNGSIFTTTLVKHVH